MAWTVGKTRRTLRRVERGLGDYNAVRRGRVRQRIVNRLLGRMLNRLVPWR